MKNLNKNKITITTTIIIITMVLWVVIIWLTMATIINKAISSIETNKLRFKFFYKAIVISNLVLLSLLLQNTNSFLKK